MGLILLLVLSQLGRLERPKPKPAQGPGPGTKYVPNINGTTCSSLEAVKPLLSPIK